MKRFLMIVSGDLFDGNGLAPLNVVGVCLAMIGILLYNIVKDGDFTFATSSTSGGGGGSVGLVQELPPWIALSKVFIDPIFSFFAVTLIRPISFFCSACSLIFPIEIQRSLSSIVGYISMLVSVASRKLYGDMLPTDSNGISSSFSSSSSTSSESFETSENSNSTLTSSTSHQRRQQVVISITSSLET